jgi:flagellar FliL protein
MSKAAAATADDAVAVDAAPKKGKKKLIIILAVVLLLALAGGGGAAFYLKKKHAAEMAAAEGDDSDGERAAAAAEERRKEFAKHPPVFVPLEPFVVNLADKETDRFAQIGVTLEVEDAKFAEEMKAYMPAIRNGILLVLSHKTSTQLLSREGKAALAREIMRESVLPLGIEVSDDRAAPADDEAPADDSGDGEPKKARKAGMANPVKHVLFSNFIVQ